MKTILTLFMALLCQISLSQSFWVNDVVYLKQGFNNDGDSVISERSVVENALGQAENSDLFTEDSLSNYLSLGFGGDIVLSMEHPIKNIDGFDLKVYETTFGSTSCRRYPEKIMLFASQDNCNWYFCGYGCQDTEFDLGELNWAQYIRLIDVSPYGFFDPHGPCDGYDLDGVEGYEVETELLPTNLVPGSAQHVIEFSQGLKKDGTPVASSRSNPENSLGIPQGTEVVNFVSLGFGGQIVLKFDFVVFNKESFDFKITETTYGNPECENYPETAFIEVSMDGTNWEFVGIICLDEMIDLDTITCFQYIKITDRSPLSEFSNSADGYDVDGVFDLSVCGGEYRVDYDDIITMDEKPELTLKPNPFNETITFNLTQSKDVRIYDFLGKLIKELNNITETLDVSYLPSGIYYFEVRTDTTISSHKLFKK